MPSLLIEPNRNRAFESSYELSCYLVHEATRFQRLKTSPGGALFLQTPILQVLRGASLIHGVAGYGTQGTLNLTCQDYRNSHHRFYDIDMPTDTFVTLEDVRTCPIPVVNDPFAALSGTQSYYDPKPMFWKNGLVTHQEYFWPVACIYFHLDLSFLTGGGRLAINLLSSYSSGYGGALGAAVERTILLDVPSRPRLSDSDAQDRAASRWVRASQFGFLFWPTGRASINPSNLQSFSEYTNALQFQFGFVTYGSTPTSLTFTSDYVTGGGAAENPVLGIRTQDFKDSLRRIISSNC